MLFGLFIIVNGNREERVWQFFDTEGVGKERASRGDGWDGVEARREKGGRGKGNE
jgi:hypothetical protein